MYRILQTVVCTALAAMAAGPADLPVDLERGAHGCMQAIFDGRIGEALDTAEVLCARYPGVPAALLLRVSALQARLSGNMTRKAEGEFYTAADLAIAAATRVLVTDADDYWAQYTVAGAQGAKALHELDQKRWLAALRHAWAGVNLLRELKDAYPSQVDLDFGIGCYEYWVTRYAGISGNRGGSALQGIRRLYTVAAQGDFTRLPAATQLLKILATERRFDEARVLAARMGLKAPGSACVATPAMVAAASQQ